MDTVRRERELAYLTGARDTHLVKVISGVRRSGKSTLLELYKRELLISGVEERNIIHLNFEDLANEALLDYGTLHQYILDRLQDGKNYIFLDEIQNVVAFEKLVDSLFIRRNIDLYITGSNAYFMSGEFATFLTGRYVEVKVYPFSFAEFVSARADTSRTDLLFEEYLTYGGFPEVTNLIKAGQTEVVNDYLLGIYNTVLNKDIVPRFRLGDVTTLEGVTKYLLSNIGSLTSPKKIADYLTSHHNKTSYNTVDKYLSALTAGLLFYSAQREDIKGKQLLQTLHKYYTVDLGFRRSMLTMDEGLDRGHLLENVVYFELLRRRNVVTVGKTDGAEVDFVARHIDTGEKVYYQVAYTMKEQSTLARELAPYTKIDDHYRKVLLSTDTGTFDIDGVQHINVVDWLLATK